MGTRSILINYNGYPSTLDSLTPDNGLASLAGTLIENGHQTLIMDFCTVDIIERLIPPGLVVQLKDLYYEVVSDMHSKGRLDQKTLDRLIYLDRVIKESGDEVVDSIAQEIIAQAKDSDVDFIGFKLWTGEGFRGSVRIAELIRRELPHVKLFAGGPHIDWFMQNVFDYTDVFDVLAYGEGEETILWLADYVEGKCELSQIPNIIYKRDSKVVVNRLTRIGDLNSLADPVYDPAIYPAMANDQKVKFIMIDESRGCPNACYFCIHPRKSGNRWRTRDHKKVVDLISRISDKLKTTVFRLSGSNTPIHLKERIARELIARNMKINYSAFGHPRDGEREDYDLLYRSGCISLAFGVESGSQKILDIDINKKVKVEQIISSLKSCKRSGILTVASIIMPNPHDTADTIQETLNVLIECQPDSVTLQLPGVIPGTYWYENCDYFGFELDEDYMFRSMTYSIRLLLPPILWDPLPYKIGGKTSQEAIMIAQKFSLDLERNGILTGIGDFLLCIGRYIGKPARELRDLNRAVFFSGDSVEISHLVKLFNSRAKEDLISLGVAGGDF